MRGLAWLSILVGIVSLIIGIISRAVATPVPIPTGTGIEAQAFLQFTNTCFLFAIAMALLKK